MPSNLRERSDRGPFATDGGYLGRALHVPIPSQPYPPTRFSVPGIAGSFTRGGGGPELTLPLSAKMGKIDELAPREDSIEQQITICHLDLHLSSGNIRSQVPLLPSFLPFHATPRRPAVQQLAHCPLSPSLPLALHLERIAPIWNVHRSGHRRRRRHWGIEIRRASARARQGERVQHACSVAVGPSVGPSLSAIISTNGPRLPLSLPHSKSTLVKRCDIR